MRQVSESFTKVPDWLLEADLSLGAFKMYVLLASYTSPGDNTARPSLTTLSNRLGVSRPTVNKWKQELADLGAITVKNRYYENGTGQMSNQYVINTRKPAPKSKKKPAAKTKEKPAPSKASFTSSAPESEARPSKARLTRVVKPALPGWLSQLYTEQEPKNKNHRTRITADAAAAHTYRIEGVETMTEQPALDGLNVEPVEGEIVTTDKQPETDNQPTAQTLIAEWLDNRQTRPPSRVIGQLSKEIKNLLNEGYDYELVRAAVGQWHQRNLHPATLPSVLDGLQNVQNGAVGGTAAERRLIAGQLRDKALAERTEAPVDPFAVEAQQLNQTTPRQLGNGDTAA